MFFEKPLWVVNLFPKQASDRPGSPDEEVVLSHKPEPVGPSAEEEEDFNKELAKMMLDSTQEARKVDRKAAAVMWETAVMTGGAKKKKEDTEKSSANGFDADVMKFTLLSRKGNKQIVGTSLARPLLVLTPNHPQTKELVVPESAPIAVHTRNAQLQDKFEQQQLKKLVLDYEYREGMEEYQGMPCKGFIFA